MDKAPSRAPCRDQAYRFPAVGAFVFGERPAASPGQLAAQLAGGAVAVAGIAALSRSSVAAMETAPSNQRTCARTT